MDLPVEYSDIPKLIHAIWLGPFTEPVEWLKTWEPFCATYKWKFKLWRDSDIRDLKLINEKEYNESVSYQQKSDIARYEIVYRFGGVYIDCDMIWLGNDLEKFLPLKSGMFIGVNESPSPSLNKTIRSPFIANGFFIAPKHHSILKRCIGKIPERVKMDTKHTFIKTGPSLLNECVKEPIIVLPDTWIFPMDFHFEHNIKDPTIFSDRAVIFTYNGFEYPHMKKLKLLKDTGKCSGDDCAALM